MEQISLFEVANSDTLKDEAVNEALFDEDSPSSEQSDEIELLVYTPEQQDMLSFAQGIISESLDPWCPLGIYITPKKYFKIDYEVDAVEKTAFLQLTSLAKAQASVNTRAQFKGATIKSIVEVSEDDIPSKAKILNNSSDTLSFEVDLSLSKPKWFSIIYRKTSDRVQMFGKYKTVNNSEQFESFFSKYRPTNKNGFFIVDTTSTSHEALMELLYDMRPILKDRLKFIYDHRIVEQCSCEKQSGTVSKEYYVDVMGGELTADNVINDSFVKVSDWCCIDQKRCLSESREMQMKCSFRKLMERKGVFVLPPLHKGD